MSALFSLKGCHYRLPWFYGLMDILKRGIWRDRRFFLAVRHIKPGDSVVDVCAGPGRLRGYLPPGCAYAAVDASTDFLDALTRQGVRCVAHDLHAGYPDGVPSSDVLVMIISLAQFRRTSAGDLLEAFKKKASRVVVVEEVLPVARDPAGWYQRCVDHLCAIEAYVPVTWYTDEECVRVLQDHGYRCERAGRDHIVGVYP